MNTKLNTTLIDIKNPRYTAITNRIPVKKWRLPDDVKGPVWLSSDASDYVNGAIVPVDSGYLAM